jgi:hypothetical protein
VYQLGVIAALPNTSIWYHLRQRNVKLDIEDFDMFAPATPPSHFLRLMIPTKRVGPGVLTRLIDHNNGCDWQHHDMKDDDYEYPHIDGLTYFERINGEVINDIAGTQVTKDMVNEMRIAIDHQLTVIKQLLWLAFTPSTPVSSTTGVTNASTMASAKGHGGIGSDLAMIICQYLHRPLTIEQHRRAYIWNTLPRLLCSYDDAYDDNTSDEVHRLLDNMYEPTKTIASTSSTSGSDGTCDINAINDAMDGEGGTSAAVSLTIDDYYYRPYPTLLHALIHRWFEYKASEQPELRLTVWRMLQQRYGMDMHRLAAIPYPTLTPGTFGTSFMEFLCGFGLCAEEIDIFIDSKAPRSSPLSVHYSSPHCGPSLLFLLYPREIYHKGVVTKLISLGIDTTLVKNPTAAAVAGTSPKTFMQLVHDNEDTVFADHRSTILEELSAAITTDAI